VVLGTPAGGIRGPEREEDLVARKRKFLAVTPLREIPADVRDGLLQAFEGTRVSCQMCHAECVLDKAIPADEWDIFYCIECSTRTGLTIKEVVEQLITGLSISYTRFLLLMQILKAEPGTRRYEAFKAQLIEQGVQIKTWNESEY